jgi:hypothetical protein
MQVHHSQNKVVRQLESWRQHVRGSRRRAAEPPHPSYASLAAVTQARRAGVGACSRCVLEVVARLRDRTATGTSSGQ